MDRPGSEYHQMVLPLHQLERNKELAEERRNQLLEIFRRIGIIMLSLSFLLAVMGLTAILFATETPEFTFATGVPLIIGLLGILGAVETYVLAVKGTNLEKYTMTRKLKCHFYGFAFTTCGALFSGVAYLIISLSEHSDATTLVHGADDGIRHPLGVVLSILIAMVCACGMIALGFLIAFQRPLGNGEMAIYDRWTDDTNRAESAKHKYLQMKTLREDEPPDMKGHLEFENPMMFGNGGVGEEKPPEAIMEPLMDNRGYYVWN
ncbi:uncharacterized protein LOC121367936 [Gigantopelta aegis]|uniref:uncharacterized protein LOC121367936 n=1 Tax=Gigantopelta aegis TaxID=1735272 RepID=UPI001B889397|nr:uncharacterized protein LOC121367936 [Gigantopelta aegis]